MGLDLRINFDAFLSYIKEQLNVSEIAGLIEQYDPAKPVVAQFPLIAQIVNALVVSLQWNRENGGWTSDKAVEFGAEALDRLLVFEGTLWGVFPAGALLESADKPLMRLILEQAYRAIRDGFGPGEQGKSSFLEFVIKKFKK